MSPDGLGTGQTGLPIFIIIIIIIIVQLPARQGSWDLTEYKTEASVYEWTESTELEWALCKKPNQAPQLPQRPH